MIDKYGVASSVVRHGGMMARWEIEGVISGYEYGSLEHCYMKHLIDVTSPLYSCNRPPGAAGALIKLRDVIVYGWVGPTAFSPSCNSIGCEIEDGHCVRNIHAEVQAIIRAARLGLATEKAAIYSILKPCYNCSKAIIHAGITKIFYAGAAYDESRTNNILRVAGVESTHLDVGLEYGND
jgi:dCMP deaminase